MNPLTTVFFKSLSFTDDKQVLIILILQVRFLSHILSFSKKEGNDLYNDALKTFYLQLYGIRHTVKDHSDSKREREKKPKATTTWATLFDIALTTHIAQPLLHQLWNTGWNQKRLNGSTQSEPTIYHVGTLNSYCYPFNHIIINVLYESLNKKCPPFVPSTDFPIIAM